MRCPSCGNENRKGARFCDSCGAELLAAQAPAEAPSAESLPDDVPTEIAGRYRVRRFLGQGGRKRVYLSTDTTSGAEVALALYDTAGVGAAIQARARREAEAMRKLGDHSHVVTVLDAGEDDGNPFIVSIYMPGGDVQGLLAAAGGHLEVPRAVEIAADVTRALEHAHARGIVHRDLKPANVWIDDDGHARLGDFGLATTEARSRVSGGTLVGTVAYLPPEQALGEAAGPAQRPLLARRPALRDAHRPASVPRRRRGLDHQPAPARRPGAALAAQPRRPRGARPCRDGAARQAPGGSPGECRRGSEADPRCPGGEGGTRRLAQPIPSRAWLVVSSSAASGSSTGCARPWTRRWAAEGRYSCWWESRASGRPGRLRSSPPTRASAAHVCTGAAAARMREHLPTGPGCRRFAPMPAKPIRSPWRGSSGAARPSSRS